MACTTHHRACDCREAQYRETREAARLLLGAIEILQPTMKVPEHLSPVKAMRRLRDLVGHVACSVCGEPIIHLAVAVGEPGGPWSHTICVEATAPSREAT